MPKITPKIGTSTGFMPQPKKSGRIIKPTKLPPQKKDDFKII